MKTHSMLFKTDMVKALLAGNKTQTRRPMKDQPEEIPESDGDYWFSSNKAGTTVRISTLSRMLREDPKFINLVSPWEIGDLIYVRETYAIKPAMEYGEAGDPVYKADGFYTPKKWIPSACMPREHSRLTLKVTGVRVERVRDISKQDAEKEGFKLPPTSYQGFAIGARANFIFNWERTYGDSWKRNDWVWVIDFDAIKQNVDHYLAVLEDE